MTRRTSSMWMNRFAWAALTICLATPLTAQTTLDRVDPAKVEAQAPRPTKPITDVPFQDNLSPAGTVSAAPPITVGAITISGLSVLHQSDFADIFAIYVGRTLSPGALAGLADALAERAHSRGYVLASASIPAQPLTAGVLRVDMDEGRIDGIRLRGAANRAVDCALMPLVGTGPVTLAALERRLLLAGDIDGLWLRRTRLVREGTRNVLEVDVARDRFSGAVGTDNSGSRPIGPVQADLTVRAAQLFAPDDVITLTALLTPTEPSEFGYLRASYGKRVSVSGTELSVSGSYSRSHPGSYLLRRDIDGTSWTVGAAMLQPLERQRRASLWLNAGLSMRTVMQDRTGQLARRDRLTVARMGLNGFAQVAGGRLRASATVSQGLDLFGATAAGDPLASRADADGAFTTIAAAADWTRSIAPNVSARVAVASQIAFQPLLVSEETGLGGGDFLRAYDYSERSGDNGAMASGELRWDAAPKVALMAKPQLYGFVDGGRVTNLRGGFGTGTLVSVGGGVRGQVAGLFDVDVGVAVPLSGPRYDSGNSAPVLNFRLSRRF